MVEYSMKAFPTEYRGRLYRSRLEARWAAFFDLLGWTHEYEPVDLGGWSPDFLISGCNAGNVFAEVKPIDSFDLETATKMSNACRERGECRTLFLLGVRPFVMEHKACIGWVGWSLDRPDSWSADPIGWISRHDCPAFDADVISRQDDASWWTGHFVSAGTDDDPPYYPEHTMKLWAAATNAVQWMPK